MWTQVYDSMLHVAITLAFLYPKSASKPGVIQPHVPVNSSIPAPLLVPLKKTSIEINETGRVAFDSGLASGSTGNN